MTDSAWYVDTSVILRAVLEKSTATRRWLSTAISAGDRFVSSRLLELETTRVLKNAGLDASIGTSYIDLFHLMPLTDDLVDTGIELEQRVGSADALHIATALKIGIGTVTIATHDRQMAVAAMDLGFEVIDPVTDDPNRRPVTEPASATSG